MWSRFFGTQCSLSFDSVFYCYAENCTGLRYGIAAAEYVNGSSRPDLILYIKLVLPIEPALD